MSEAQRQLQHANEQLDLAEQYPDRDRGQPRERVHQMMPRCWIVYSEVLQPPNPSLPAFAGVTGRGAPEALRLIAGVPSKRSVTQPPVFLDEGYFGLGKVV